MKWKGPSPRAMTMGLWGEHLTTVEALQKAVQGRGVDITLADVVRDLVKVYGPKWLAELEGETEHEQGDTDGTARPRS
jgi:hypothetical protein